MKKNYTIVLAILAFCSGNVYGQEQVTVEHKPDMGCQPDVQKSQNQFPEIIMAVYDSTSRAFKFSCPFVSPIYYCIYNENGNVIQSGVCVKDNCAYTIDLCNIPPCQISIEIMIQGVLFMGSFQV